VSEGFLARTHPAGQVTAIALLLHGGTVRSFRDDRRTGLAAARMYTFQRRLARSGGPLGLATAVLRYRTVGWNDADPVADAEAALHALRSDHPGVPIALVGHSMGGRVALRIAGQEAVTAISALAPWIPSGEPVRQLAGRSVLILHGERDRTTPAIESLAYARAAVHHAGRLARFEIMGAGHKLIRRTGLWHDLTVRFTLAGLGLRPLDPDLTAAFALEPAQRIRLPL
jgi:pimeloyl-ACP methyl ester carboxylesterase